MATPLSLYDQANTTPTGTAPINFGAISQGTVTNPTTPTANTALSSNNLLAQPGAAPVPPGTLPTPTTNNNLAPGGHTTALPGGGAQPGTTLPQPQIVPQLSVTQTLNTPVPATTDLSKYGTQGTASATTASSDAAAKYAALHDQLKGTDAPATNPMRTDEMQQKMTDTQQTPQEDPQKTFMDNYSSMNPVVKNMFDNINQLVSSQNTRQSLQDEFTQLTKEQGLPELNTELMNIKNVMDGTEDDIRNEITKAGGFATESQVAALTASRNKVLLKQANYLQQQIQTKDDYVNQIMQFSEQDRAEVDKQVSQQIGIDEKVAETQISLDNAARDNYTNIVSKIGYDGLAKAFNGNPTARANAEEILGLPKGALLNPAFLASTSSNPSNQFTLGPGSKRFDSQGNVIASVPAAGSGGGGGGSSDPYVQSWVSNVLNGNATMQQVPAALRNEVSLEMANAPATSYSPLAASRFTMAANRIVSNFIKLPEYELTANGLPYLQRIDAAMKTPGSVSDQDLLDSLTKLNTSGNAISDAQVKIITGGKSFSDIASTLQNKFQNGGVLSDNQRQQIQTIAKAIFSNYSKGYQPVYDQAVSQLQAAGIPKAFWTIPDLNNLSGQSVTSDQPQSDSLPGLGGAPISGQPQFGSLMMTDFQTANGVMYAKGTDGTYYPI